MQNWNLFLYFNHCTDKNNAPRKEEGGMIIPLQTVHDPCKSVNIVHVHGVRLYMNIYRIYE